MTPEELENHPGWRWCTPQGARDQVLLLGLETSFREKLEWLEEAEELADRMSGRNATHPSPKHGAAAPDDSEGKRQQS